jgi:hypothetical protein
LRREGKTNSFSGVGYLILVYQLNIMDLQANIKWIQHELNKVNDPALIQTLVSILKNRHLHVDSFLEQYNREIDEANARIDSGAYITQEDLEKEASQW